jgi:hypothetical protein
MGIFCANFFQKTPVLRRKYLCVLGFAPKENALGAD